jgi:hypothetical protein
MFSEEYKKWVGQSGMKNLTNTQHRFAEWLLQDDIAKVIAQIGDLDAIFISVRQYIKRGKEPLKKYQKIQNTKNDI